MKNFYIFSEKFLFSSGSQIAVITKQNNGQMSGIRRTFLLAFFFILLVSGGMVHAQLPVITVRFANPIYNCAAQTFTLDVEFQSNTANQKLYGMNVRFFYDDVVLEYVSMGNFVAGYAAVSPNPAVVTTSNAASGAALFGFPAGHPFEFVNGAVQLTGSSSLYLSTTAWTRIFTITFHIDDAASLNMANFSPSVIWDLEVNPANGGWLNGDDGVVISVAAPAPLYSSPTTENVLQHNWQYNPAGTAPYGAPSVTLPISTLALSASITSQTSALCAGSSNGTATVGVSGGTAPYTYIWSTSPAVTTATVTGLAPGNYSVTVKDAFNCMVTTGLTIIQNPLPSLNNVTGSGTYCALNAGQLVGLDGSQTGVDYTLLPSNIVVPGTGTSVNFGMQPAGTYTIRAANSTTGCQKMMTGAAIVSAVQPSVVGISITATTNVVTNDEEVTLTAHPVNGGTTPGYQWKVNGGTVGQNSATFTFTPDDGDQVNCVLTSSLGCVIGNPAASNTVVMAVQNIAQNYTVTGDMINGDVHCYNATQTLTVAGSGTTFTVQNGATANLVAGSMIRLLPGAKVLSGGYMHAYITTNNQYCGQTPPTSSPVTTGVGGTSSAKSASYSIYPNPTSDNFTVEQLRGKPEAGVEVLVFGMKGEQLLSETLMGEHKHLVRSSDLPVGLYFVKIVAGGNVETFKLVKIK